MEPVIELVELTKKYGELTAVDHLNLTINKGEIFGLLGPNGAGKSTTILMMLGLTEPDYGTAKILGIHAATSPVEVKKRVGYLPDSVGFYDNMSGLENLVYIARLNRFPAGVAKEHAMQLLERVGLAEAAGKKTGKYSRGMLQRLGLAEVLIKNPGIIILDEPTLGIDPKGVKEFLELIVRLSREEGLTVLLSSHHLHQVQQVCDRVGLFVRGKLIAEGNIASLSERLFAGDLFIIEAGVIIPQEGLNGAPAAIVRLQEQLLGMEGVKSAGYHGGLLRLSCTRDLSAVIAKTIVTAGIGLSSLSKKAHGLDDIYSRYFEAEEVA